MYIVGFNGPPYSGKDTAAQMLVKRIEEFHDIPVKVDPLSLPLRQIAYATVGSHYDHGTCDTYDEFKTTRFEHLDMTGRDLMISASENWLKPRLGSGVMTKLLLQRNEGFEGVLIVPDSGFQCEVGPLSDAVGVNNLFLARVRRDACSFDGDSREWVYTTHDIDIDNCGSLDWLENQVQDYVYQSVVDLNWSL